MYIHLESTLHAHVLTHMKQSDSNYCT